MSESQASKKRSSKGIKIIVFACLFYFVSLGPVEALARVNKMTPAFWSWVVPVYEPAQWVIDKTGLSVAFHSYVLLWEKLIRAFV